MITIDMIAELDDKCLVGSRGFRQQACCVLDFLDHHQRGGEEHNVGSQDAGLSSFNTDYTKHGFHEHVAALSRAQQQTQLAQRSLQLRS